MALIKLRFPPAMSCCENHWSMYWKLSQLLMTKHGTSHGYGQMLDVILMANGNSGHLKRKIIADKEINGCRNSTFNEGDVLLYGCPVVPTGPENEASPKSLPGACWGVHRCTSPTLNDLTFFPLDDLPWWKVQCLGDFVSYFESNA